MKAQPLVTITRTLSGERAVVRPESFLPPTVDDLLAMFGESTQVGEDPLDGLLSDTDILDETFIVGEDELLTLPNPEEMTQVTHLVCLQVYYVWAVVQDVDLIPPSAWSYITYAPNGLEEYVGMAHVCGQLAQVYKTVDGYAAQPIEEKV